MQDFKIIMMIKTYAEFSTGWVRLELFVHKQRDKNLHTCDRILFMNHWNGPRKIAEQGIIRMRITMHLNRNQWQAVVINLPSGGEATCSIAADHFPIWSHHAFVLSICSCSCHLACCKRCISVANCSVIYIYVKELTRVVVGTTQPLGNEQLLE